MRSISAAWKFFKRAPIDSLFCSSGLSMVLQEDRTSRERPRFFVMAISEKRGLSLICLVLHHLLVDSETMTVAPHRLCIAPMMDWSDRHCRYFLRQVSSRAWLYTETITP